MDWQDESKNDLNRSVCDELPAAKKICLDHDNVSSSCEETDKLISETTLRLSNLLSPNRSQTKIAVCDNSNASFQDDNTKIEQSSFENSSFSLGKLFSQTSFRSDDYKGDNKLFSSSEISGVAFQSEEKERKILSSPSKHSETIKGERKLSLNQKNVPEISFMNDLEGELSQNVTFEHSESAEKNVSCTFDNSESQISFGKLFCSSDASSRIESQSITSKKMTVKETETKISSHNQTSTSIISETGKSLEVSNLYASLGSDTAEKNLSTTLELNKNDLDVSSCNKQLEVRGKFDSQVSEGSSIHDNSEAIASHTVLSASHFVLSETNHINEGPDTAGENDSSTFELNNKSDSVLPLNSTFSTSKNNHENNSEKIMLPPCSHSYNTSEVLSLSVSSEGSQNVINDSSVMSSTELRTSLLNNASQVQNRSDSETALGSLYNLANISQGGTTHKLDINESSILVATCQSEIKESKLNYTDTKDSNVTASQLHKSDPEVSFDKLFNLSNVPEGTTHKLSINDFSISVDKSQSEVEIKGSKLNDTDNNVTASQFHNRSDPEVSFGNLFNLSDRSEGDAAYRLKNNSCIFDNKNQNEVENKTSNLDGSATKDSNTYQFHNRSDSNMSFSNLFNLSEDSISHKLDTNESSILVDKSQSEVEIKGSKLNDTGTNVTASQFHNRSDPEISFGNLFNLSNMSKDGTSHKLSINDSILVDKSQSEVEIKGSKLNGTDTKDNIVTASQFHNRSDPEVSFGNLFNLSNTPEGISTHKLSINDSSILVDKSQSEVEIKGCKQNDTDTNVTACQFHNRSDPEVSFGNLFNLSNMSEGGTTHRLNRNDSCILVDKSQNEVEIKESELGAETTVKSLTDHEQDAQPSHCVTAAEYSNSLEKTSSVGETNAENFDEVNEMEFERNNIPLNLKYNNSFDTLNKTNVSLSGNELLTNTDIDGKNNITRNYDHGGENNLNISTKAFDTNKMNVDDESQSSSLSSEKCLIPSGLKHYNALRNSLLLKEENINQTENPIEYNRKEVINSTNRFDNSLDFTCNPVAAESTILCEETVVLCQSIIVREGEFSEQKNTQAFVKHNLSTSPVETGMKEIESESDNFVSPLKKSIDLSFNCSDSVSAMQETSGFALDYTLTASIQNPKSVNDSVTKENSLLENDVSKDNSGFIAQGVNNEILLEVNKSIFPDEVKPPDFNQNSDDMEYNNIDITAGNIRNLENQKHHIPQLSENIDAGLRNNSKKNFSAEEVAFLREDLLKVMELLKNENNSFEAYKMTSETEKCQLKEKIMDLEKQLEKNRTLEVNNTSALEIKDSDAIDELKEMLKHKDREISNLVESNKTTIEQLTNTQKDLDYLSRQVIITENHFEENKAIINTIHDLNMSVDNIFTLLIPGKSQFVVNFENMCNILFLLSEEAKKNSSFKKDYGVTLNEHEELKKEMNRLKNVTEGYINNENSLKNSYEETVKNFKVLELENLNLKSEIDSKIGELSNIKLLVENLTDQLAELQKVRASEQGKIENYEALKVEIDLKNVDIQNLKTRNVILEQQINDMKHDYEKLKEVSVSKEDFNSLHERFKVVELQLDEKTIMLTEKDHNFEQLLMLLNEEKVSCTDLKNCNILLTEEVNKLRECITELNEDLKKTKADNAIQLTNSKNDQEQIKSILQEKCSMMDTLNDMTLKYENLRQQLDEEITNNKLLEESYKQSKSEVDELNSLIENLNNRITLILSEQEQLKAQYDVKQNLLICSEENYRQLQLSYDSLVKESEGKNMEVNSLSINIVGVSEENAALKEKVLELQHNHEDLMTKYNKKEDDIVVLETDFKKIDARLKDVMIDCKNLKEQCNAKDQECNILTEKKNCLESELASANLKIETTLQELIQLRVDYELCYEKLGNTEKQIVNLNEERSHFTEIEHFNKDLKEKYEQLVDDNCKKNMELEHLAEKLEECKNCNINLKTEIDSLNNCINELNTNLASCKFENDLLLTEKSSCQEKVNEMQKENLSMQSKFNEVMTTCETLKSSLLTKELENKLILDSTRELEIKIQTLSTDLAEWHNKVEILETDNEKLRAENVSDKELLLKTNNAYADLKDSFDDILKKIEIKNQEIIVFKETNEQITEEIRSLTAECSTLKDKYFNLEAEHEALFRKQLESEEECSKTSINYNQLEIKFNEVLLECEDFKTKYNEQLEAYNLIKEKSDTLEKEFSFCKSEFERAQEQLQTVKADYEISVKRSESLEVDLIAVNKEKQQFLEVIKLHEHMKDQYEESITKIDEKNEKIGSLTLKLEELEGCNIALKTEINSLNQCINELNKDLSSTKSENDLFLSEKLGFQEEINKLQEENSSMQSKLAESMAVCETLKSSLQAKEQDYELVKDSNKQLEIKIETLNTNLTISCDKVEKLESDNKQLRAENGSEKELLSKAKNEYENLRNSFDDIFKELQIKNQEINVLKETNEQINEEIKTLSAECSLLKDKCVNLQIEHEELSRKHIESKEEYSKTLLNCNELKIKYDGMSSEYEEFKTKYNKQLETYKLLEEKSELLEKDLISSKSDYENTQEHYMSLKTDYDITVRKLENLEVELRRINNEKEGLVEKIKFNEQFREKYEDLFVEFDKQNDTVESLLKELAYLKECNNSLKTEINDLNNNWNDQLITCKKNEERLLADNSKFQQEIHDLKNEKNVILVTNNELTESYEELKSLLITKEHDYELIKELNKQLEEKVQVLNSSLAESNSKVMELQSDWDQLKADNESDKGLIIKLENDYLSLKKSSGEIQEELKMKKQEIKTLQESEEKHIKELINLNEECSSTKQKQAILEKDYEALYTKYLVNEENLAKTLSDQNQLEINYKQAVSHHEDLKTKYSSLTDAYNLLKEKSEVLEKDFSASKSELEGMIEKLSSLKADYEITINKSQKMEEEVNALKNENQCFIESIKSYENIKEKYNEQLVDIDKKNAKLQCFVKQLEDLEECNVTLKKEISSLNSFWNDHLSVCKAEKDELLSKNLTIQQEITKLKDENSNIQSVINEMTMTNESLRHSLHAKEKDYLNLKTSLKETNEELQLKNSEIDTLRKTNVQLADEVRSLSNECSSIKDETEKQLTNMNNEKKQVENNNSEMKQKIEELLMQNKNLDEECEVLNADIKYNEKVISNMFKQHSEELNEVKESLKKEERKREEIVLENSSLKDKIKTLENNILKIKTTSPAPCSSCAELKNDLQQLKVDLVDRTSKVSSLEVQIVESEATHKKMIQDYCKKVFTLQEKLGATLNKLEKEEASKKVSRNEAYVQTDNPLQLSGQSGGIVQSVKLKEQDQIIKKMEKENLVLKRLCQTRLDKIKELQGQLKPESTSKIQKPQRNVLEQLQNHKT